MPSNTEIVTETSAALGNNPSVNQILHTGDDSGVTATLLPLYTLDGVATGLFISTTHIGSDYFDLTEGLSSPTHKEGRIFYDDNEKTLAVYNSEADVTLQLGQEEYIRSTNKTGTQIDNGTLVYISGAQGNRPTIVKAKADSAATSMVIAMTTHDIADNATGFCTTFGLVRGLNTNAHIAGTTLYLSDSTAGAWTATAPTQPSFPIQIGTVIVQNVNEGEILVNMGPTDVAGHMVIDSLALNAQLNLAEITTPTAIPDYGAIYFKADNKLYAQTGDGVEHEVAFV